MHDVSATVENLYNSDVDRLDEPKCREKASASPHNSLFRYIIKICLFVSSWRDNRFFFYVSARHHAQNDSDRVSVHFYVGAVSLVRNNWDTKVEDGLNLIRPEERPRSTRRKHGHASLQTIQNDELHVAVWFLDHEKNEGRENSTRTPHTLFFCCCTLQHAKKYWGLQRCNINILTRIQMSAMVQNARTRCPPWV